MRFFIYAITMLWSFSAIAKPADLYLFYNSESENLNEIQITPSEVAKAFEDTYGPASEELPKKVRYQDFFVSKFPDGRYVFTLNALYNCGQIGCATEIFERDADGDLQPSEPLFPVKCKYHGTDKLICIKGGYKVNPKPKEKRRGPVHYPAPAEQ
ncbi:MAG: hypothetical protein E7018_07145 [Alphaproteobacteria bacterium]|nr:hypothetical protein [Alphaproteobacteria bacterium]